MTIPKKRKAKTENNLTIHTGTEWNKFVKFKHCNTTEKVERNTTLHNNICKTKIMLDKTSYI